MSRAVLTGVDQPNIVTDLVLRSGQWATAPAMAATAVPTLNDFRFSPITFAQGGSINALGVLVSNAGTTGALVRLGIYEQTTADPLLFTLLAEPTTQGAGDAAGAKTLSLSTPLRVERGKVYAVGSVSQVATSTVYCGGPSRASVTGTDLNGILGSTSVAGYVVTGVTGALPSTISAPALNVGSMPRVAVRAV